MKHNPENINILSNQEGSVLLMTVLIMILLTIIGIMGINTSSSDLEVTRNYKVYKENLVLADAAVNEARTLVLRGVVDTSASWVNNIIDLYNQNSAYFKKGTSYDTANTPVQHEIDVKRLIQDWDTFKDGNSANDIPSINPTSLSSSEPDTEYIVYKNLNLPKEQIVVIVRSRKNGGDVILEAAFAEP
ncbi:MAG: hypothetical protein CSA18_02330 [Deltaproteobacteria bacterium]|nr:MAG: hypothetical protein CSB21_01135 [Deltaproteobacteria bacterium]PIE74968.1 MAG: hypothetical protein CSA18_02330 [Deltaproteobacteria bacterium]